MAKSERIQKRVQRAADLLFAGEFGQAGELLLDVLQSDPRNADASYLLGLIRCRERRFDEAAARFAHAVQRNPQHANAHNELGLVLQALGRQAEAIASFRRAIAADGAHALAHYNLGCLLQAQNQHADAVASFERAQQFAPHDSDMANNLGNSLQLLGRYPEAVASYDRALALRPGFAEALNNRGNTRLAQYLYTDALADFGQAIALRADYADARFNAGFTQLLLGDFEAGWRNHEWRRMRDDWSDGRSEFSAPPWLGQEDLAGKTILLHAEQGFGDTIHFARFATPVAKRGARVIMEVQPALVSLIAGVEGVASVIARGDARPHFDAHCPLLSLPLALGTQVSEFSSAFAGAGGYLAPPASAREKWRDRIAAAATPRVGVAWAGRRQQANDKNRSAALAHLAPLFAIPGIHWISLQKELREGDAELLARYPDVVEYREALQDFADTAALIEQLDLVVTVDTGVAHLAGAMGKPVWIMLTYGADWRWLLDREDSPWYPTARLFRQTAAGDWEGVIRRVEAALRAETIGK
jgi:Flp pilus assembly protein TadD